MKNVLVTGGSRGIGAECVRSFAKDGYNVFFIYKNSRDKAKKLSKETGATAVYADIGKSSDIKNAAEFIHDICSIDILVNNAGISQIKMFQDISENDWDDMFNINIKSMFLVTKAFLNDMISKKSGRIINISSIWGEFGGSCEVHYSASKAAVIGFTKALSKELGLSGITVNCVSPGFIDTDMNGNIDKEDIELFVKETSMGRAGKASDVSEVVKYLASDKSSFITGAVIPVNGGF